MTFATVEVDGGQRFTGRIYHVRDNGWPCIETATGHIASGPEVQTVNHDAEPPAGDFYVTVRDGGRTGFLLGPYADMRDALADVDRGRDLACARNSRAWFYSYGTSRLPIGTEVRPVFALSGEPNR